MRHYFLIACCLSLTACATEEELQARREARMKADYEICINDYGFKPKSDAARNCMLQLELARQKRRNDDYHWGGYYGYRSGAYGGYTIRH